jgi:hypothetical protein
MHAGQRCILYTDAGDGRSVIEAGLAAWTGVINRSAQESQGISRP